jgi:hypothetical protein
MAWFISIWAVYRVAVGIYWTYDATIISFVNTFSSIDLLTVPGLVQNGVRSMAAVLALNFHALQHAALDVISEYFSPHKCPMGASEGVLLQHAPHLGDFIWAEGDELLRNQ